MARFTAEDWRKQRWGYYRMIEKVDAEMGKVLTALREAGLEENTLIVFTADHGECAGAHRFNQKTVRYEESARVPLIISAKRKTSGRTTDKLVNTGIDLLPTMLEFAGLEVPKKLPGRSLLPLVFGQPVTAWRNHVVVENNMRQTGEVDGFAPTMEGRMVRSIVGRAGVLLALAADERSILDAGDVARVGPREIATCSAASAG